MPTLKNALAKISKHPPIAIPRDVPLPSPGLRQSIAVWGGLADTGTLKRAVLETLSCQVTEDASTDECRLEIYTDGSLQGHRLRCDMQAGDTWPLNLSFRFNSQVLVKLFDEDSPDADDLLGVARIDGTLQNHAAASFTWDEASYSLTYSVRDFPVAGGVVAEAVSSFESSPTPGAWPHLNKSEIISGIRQRVANPQYVRQAQTPLCGPAAIVFELISRQPQRYVEICRELFETGQFRARTEKVRPSDTLRKSEKHPTTAAVDWMLLATLRDTENAIFPVDSTSGDVAMGLTTPGEMQSWTSELLCFDRIRYDSTYIAGEFTAIKQAALVRAAGGVAFLLVDGALVDGKEPVVAIPNHWISFLGGLAITGDDSHVSFLCFSWGGKPCQVDADEGTFEDYMWGVVLGES